MRISDWSQSVLFRSQAFDDRATLELRSRTIVERMALALQASVLLRAGNDAIANTWCSSRLGGEHGVNYGTLDAQAPLAAMIDRAFAKLRSEKYGDQKSTRLDSSHSCESRMPSS